MALQRLSYARSSGLFSSPFVLSDLGEPPLLLRDLQPDLYAFDDVDTHPSHLSTMKWSRSVGPEKNFTPPRIALDLIDDVGVRKGGLFLATLFTTFGRALGRISVGDVAVDIRTIGSSLDGGGFGTLDDWS